MRSQRPRQPYCFLRSPHRPSLRRRSHIRSLLVPTALRWRRASHTGEEPCIAGAASTVVVGFTGVASIEAVSIEEVFIVAPACGLAQRPDTMPGLMGSLAGTRPILHVGRGIMAAFIRASTGVASIAAASLTAVVSTDEVCTGAVCTGAVGE